MKVKRIYKKQKYFSPLSVMRTIYNKKVVAKDICYAIHLKSGENSCDWDVLLLNNHGMINKSICGYNALDTKKYSSPESLREYLVETFNIPNESIYVQGIGDTL